MHTPVSLAKRYKIYLYSNHPETIIKYFVANLINTNTASGAGISFTDARFENKEREQRNLSMQTSRH